MFCADFRRLVRLGWLTLSVVSIALLTLHTPHGTRVIAQGGNPQAPQNGANGPGGDPMFFPDADAGGNAGGDWGGNGDGGVDPNAGGGGDWGGNRGGANPVAGLGSAELRPSQGNLKLLQPLDMAQTDEIDMVDAQAAVGPSFRGIGILFYYFGLVWPWLVGVIMGISILQALIGGVEMMMSGGGGMSEEGKERIQWALAGIILLAVAGLILRTINPLFFW